MAIALFVEIELAPGTRDAFLARAHQHRANVLANEPGCERFDISVPEGTDDTIRLYEVYVDQAAFDLHMETDYMKAYREDTGSMVRERKLAKAALNNG